LIERILGFTPFLVDDPHLLTLFSTPLKVIFTGLIKPSAGKLSLPMQSTRWFWSFSHSGLRW